MIILIISEIAGLAFAGFAIVFLAAKLFAELGKIKRRKRRSPYTSIAREQEQLLGMRNKK